jgi:hypothetical protein
MMEETTTARAMSTLSIDFLSARSGESPNHAQIQSLNHLEGSFICTGFTSVWVPEMES